MSLVSRQDIEKAATSIKGVAVRTPLLPAPWLSDELGVEVRLKCENLQRTGSFKMRGAYNTIAQLPEAQRQRGVITYSSGNHGQAVALAAKMFGIKAVIVMPTTAPQIKVEGARGFGAEVVLEGTTSTHRYERAVQLIEQHGYVMIPPFDHPHIIAGQGTVGIEILEDWPEVDAVFAPIGGGGLASGIATYIKNTKPECRVIGVEPEAADAMYQSVQAHHPVTIEPKPTIADGLMPVRPGELTYLHVEQFIDEIVRVSDDEIRKSTRELIAIAKLVVEFSGAATVAALRSRRYEPGAQRLVAVISGGNLDPSRLAPLFS